MTASVFHRTSCRLCNSKNLELIIKLESIPLSENYTSDSETGRNAHRYPVDVYMCASCGHVHQLDVIDSTSLWANYTYSSGEAKGMFEHFQQVGSQLMGAYKLPTGSLVVDIGSNDGSLLKVFKVAGHRVLGIDPATEIARQASAAGIETIPELMSVTLAQRVRELHGSAQVVCMFNAFAHVDNMDDLVQSIRTVMAPTGIFVFEAQYLLDIIDSTLIATIFHEHMSHHSVKPLVGFFERHGMELIDVKRVPIQHGSIIGVVQFKRGKLKVNDSVSQILETEANRKLDKLATLRKFAESLRQHRARTKKMVMSWKESGATIAGYGAARSGPTLIAQLGLRDMIEYIFDDHPQKVGKYSSGDGIPIVPTEELNKRMPDFTLILAWVHAEKIVESNQNYLENGGHFVVLCPETHVVGKCGVVTI